MAHLIPLKNDSRSFVVDDEDAEVRIKLGWRLNPEDYVIRYVYSTASRRSAIEFVHRLIAERMLDRPLVPWPVEVVSHRNSDRLDCQRDNLMVISLGEAVTAQQRSQNSSKSQYRGVCWSGRINKWVAYIKKDGQQKHLGTFDDEMEAALAYDAVAEEAFGELARFNFERS